MHNTPKVGVVKWFDLSVANADQVSKFYQEVVGWDKEELSMGSYSDYCMNQPGTKETVAGICHAKGPNEYLPPQWLIYITVENLEKSLETCKALGGKVIGEIRKGGENATYCLIQDPGGAYAMLYEEK